MNKKVIIVRSFLSGFLLLAIMVQLLAQEGPEKPARRSDNQLNINGSLLKTVFSFTPSSYDTVSQPGPDPALVAKYSEKDLIPLMLDAVFNDQVTVYDPNYWGTIPQLLDKKSHNKFDTLQILDYLSAGWDTSYMIENDGSMKEVPEYKKIPYDEISGLFFYESWWLDSKTNGMYKDVIAYLPIREYTNTIYDGYEETEVRRRLLFMVLPEWSSGEKKRVKFRTGDFQLVKKDIQYEIRLYNKSYEQYLYREEEYGQVGQTEFGEWQYHHFDFYKHFDRNMFLEKIISAVLEGNLKAFLPGVSKSPLQAKEFIELLQRYPDQEGIMSMDDPGVSVPGIEKKAYEILPEDYPLSDLNSIEFHEDWYINPGTLQIYKDVKGITVTRTETRYDKYTGDFIKESIRPLFTVWF